MLGSKCFGLARRGLATSAEAHRVCIVGGGFGGLYTALGLSALAGRSGALEVTLVDRADRFVFLPLLYELAVGQAQPAQVAPPLAELLRGTGIRLVQAELTGLDLPNRQALLAGRPPLGWDRLVLALGSEPAVPAGCPGAAEHARPFHRMQDAMFVREWLQSASDKMPPVCVVGGGPAGVELACSLGARLATGPAVQLVEAGPALLPAAPAAQREDAAAALRRRGVQVLLNTTVAAVGPDSVTLGSDPQPASLVLWTGGSRVATKGSNIGLPACDRGQILTESTLQVRGLPGVYALGDGAASSAGSPASAQLAFQQAEYVSHNLWRSLSGQPELDFEFIPMGQMLTLGAHEGGVSAFELLQLSGSLGGAVRRAVYLARMPTHRHRASVGLGWAAGLAGELLGPGARELGEAWQQPMAELVGALEATGPAKEANAQLNRTLGPMGQVMPLVRDLRERLKEYKAF